MNERLTKRATDGQAMMDCQKCEADWTGKHGKPMSGCTALYCRNRLKDRLAAYEDTRLTPEEVSELIKDWSDLCTVVGECGGIDMIREICKAGKEKRLVVLPFRVGAKVYTIFCGEVVEKTAIEFRVNGFSKPGVSAVLATDTLAPAITPLRFAIGRTVFLTSEEAEKVLKEVEQG